jgi:hypothetical protein
VRHVFKLTNRDDATFANVNGRRARAFRQHDAATAYDEIDLTHR